MKVKLIKMPDGKLSSEYRLTLNHVYDVIDKMGCCLVIKTDDETTGSIHYSRFEVVE